MKDTYKKLMFIAYGQSLALDRMYIFLTMFDDFLNKYTNTDQFNEENIRFYLKRLEKETKLVIKDNNRIIAVAEDLK